MKRYGLRFKNIAALLMLLSLLSLLLPFCSLTVGDTTTNISGVGVLKAGARLGKEYVTNKTIDNGYEIAEGFTWKDVKSMLADASSHREIVMAVAVAVFPIVCLGLAMILTLFATGKITMFFPTLLSALAAGESIFAVVQFSNLQSFLAERGSMLTVALLIGMYAFTFFSAAAVIILLILWVTGGFDEPSLEEREQGEKKPKKSRRTKEKKRRRRRKKRGRRKDKKKVRGVGDEPEKARTKETVSEVQQEDTLVGNGACIGLSGFYLNSSLNLGEIGAVTLGVTDEARKAIESGVLSELPKTEGSTVVISYDVGSKQYVVKSHATKEVVLQTQGPEGQIRLQQGERVTVGGNTLVFLGDLSNIVKLG